MYISITKQSDMSNTVIHNTVSVLYTAYPVNLKHVPPFYIIYIHLFVYYRHSITYMQM